MYGVSKVLVHTNDEAGAGEEAGADFVEHDGDDDDDDDDDVNDDDGDNDDNSNLAENL